LPIAITSLFQKCFTIIHPKKIKTTPTVTGVVLISYPIIRTAEFVAPLEKKAAPAAVVPGAVPAPLLPLGLREHYTLGNFLLPEKKNRTVNICTYRYLLIFHACSVRL